MQIPALWYVRNGAQKAMTTYCTFHDHTTEESFIPVDALEIYKIMWPAKAVVLFLVAAHN